MSETTFDIRIVETVIYRKSLTRTEVIELLAKVGDLTTEEKQREYGSLTDEELMAEIDGDETIEEELQSEGEVEGAKWGVRVLTEHQDGYEYWALS